MLPRDLGARVALAAFLLAASACGGGPEPKQDGDPPPADAKPADSAAAPDTAPAAAPAAPARAIHHGALRDHEQEIDQALGAGGEATKEPDWAAAQAAAEKLDARADEVLKDMPASIKDEDRLRFEGLVAQLKERAKGIAQAAAAKDKLKASRTFQQLTASWVKCHTQFGQTGTGGGN